MTLYARLDKSGGRALCGMIDCGAERARIAAPYPDGRVGIESGGHIREQRGTPGRRHLNFAPGWQQDTADGRWRLTRRGREERNKARWRASGNSVPSSVAEHDRDRLRKGEATRFRRPVPSRYGLAPHQSRNSLPLPLEAVCPDCGSVNLLDAGRLDIPPR